MSDPASHAFLKALNELIDRQNDEAAHARELAGPVVSVADSATIPRVREDAHVSLARHEPAGALMTLRHAELGEGSWSTLDLRLMLR